MEYHNTAVPDVTDADSCSESNPEFRARHEATGEAASECARTQNMAVSYSATGSLAMELTPASAGIQFESWRRASRL